MSFGTENQNQGSEGGQKQFKSRPSQKYLIGEILEGEYNPDIKELSTRYGMVYRVRFMATVLEKRLSQSEKDSLFAIDAEEEETFMLTLTLDDGTGVIKANAWGVKEGDFEHIEAGDIVDVIGRIRQYREKLNILAEVIHKIADPNFETLRVLEIIKRRLSTPEQEIQTFEAGISMEEDEMELFDQDTEFNLPEEVETMESQSGGNLADLEQAIVSFIQQSNAEDGVREDFLAKKFNLSIDDLNEMLNRLSSELYVYRSGPGVWSSY